jgi:Dolichyl-phosphate-mannose-protein mannosyltransferase
VEATAEKRVLGLRRVSLSASVGLAAALGLGAANFLWQLGSSSYYVDEIQALYVALSPVRSLWHATAVYEITPPAYFAFLHEWIGRLGSSAEWVTRLPSALAGIALVGAVYWLATLLTGRRAVALAAAALTALSPYVLEYAQLAQGYIFLMLASACAVGASLEADRAASVRGRGRWLAAGALAAVLALWLHYTAGLLVVPLCVWVGSRRALTAASRSMFVGACAIGAAALIPMLIDQHGYHPHRIGVASVAGVTATTVQRIFGTPLVGRVDWLLIVATLVTTVSLVWLLAAGRSRIAEWPLIAWLAAGIPLTLFVLSIFGGHLMLTRYAAVAAPFMIVAIAACALSLGPPSAGLAVGAVAVAVAIGGLVASHQPSGFYLDAKGAARYIDDHARPQDAVLASPSAGTAEPLTWYGLRPLYFETPATVTAYKQRRRIWVIEGIPGSTTTAAIDYYLRFTARYFGYGVRRLNVFPGTVRLAVALETPTN